MTSLTMDPELSIIIPLYQMEGYLKRSLLSACRQTCNRAEILVLDDNSNDYGLELAQKIASDFGNISLYHNDRTLGLWETRKRGIRYARGRYILFLDPREWLEPDAAETLVRSIGEEGTDLVQMRRRNLAPMFARRPEEQEYPAAGNVAGQEFLDLTRKIGRNSTISPFCGDKLYRADMLREAMQIDFKGNWGEVQIMNIQYLRHARSVSFIDYFGVNVPWRDDHNNYNFGRLADYKHLYCVKRLIGQDEEFLRRELIDNLHYYISQLCNEMAWTREAVIFFISEELNDPFWRNMGISESAEELVDIYCQQKRSGRFGQIIKQLLT